MMRFVVTGEWKTNNLLRLIILFFLLYTALLWATNFFLYLGKMGLTYQSVVAYYRGSEERFLQPRSYLGLLEISHFHLFAMGILILTLTHLILFVPIVPRLKAWLIAISFLSALSDEGMGWLTRFVHPVFAYGKIGSFVLLQLSMAVLILLILIGTLKPQRNAYTDSSKNGERSDFPQSMPPRGQA